MYISSISIEHFRCFQQKQVFNFNNGLTALIGENDSGKSAVIDAIRYVLGTTDQSWNKVEISDYYDGDTSKDIQITIIFSGLSDSEKAMYMECLTYKSGNCFLYLNWNAKYIKTVKPNRTITRITSGKNGDVNMPDAESREKLRVTYLRPLRDANVQMRAGRNSRLAQIINSIPNLNDGEKAYQEGMDLSALSLTGIFDLSNNLLANHTQISNVNNNIQEIILEQMLLVNDSLSTNIAVNATDKSEERKLVSILEKLDLIIENNNSSIGVSGLGTSNIMSMACELLLNRSKDGDSSFMLIEEPEAHIHAQRQLKLIQSMQKQCNDFNCQIILTTHSNLLASVIELKNIVMIQNRKPYALDTEYTLLDESDYKYLERYLDATKANLFFARGILIVEGPGEELLLPTIANLLGRSLIDYGVSIVDVKSTGLRRYSRIFQRKDTDNQLDIPVACIADRDIMPDCAPSICIKDEYEEHSNWPTVSKRRWKVESEVEDKEKHLNSIKAKADGQSVKTFVSDSWTLEYDLALSGLGKEMLKIIAKMKKTKTNKEDALYTGYLETYNSYTEEQQKAAYVYSFFRKKIISKAEFAQYFAYHLEIEYQFTPVNEIKKLLPLYIINAIEYVTEQIDNEGQENDK